MIHLEDPHGVLARRLSRELGRTAPQEPRSFRSEEQPWSLPRQPTALVAAASETERAYAAEVLRCAEFHAAFAATGLEAVSKAFADPYDLILIEADLPVLDGLEATRRIRRLERRRGAPRAHVILVCEDGEEDDRAIAFEAGADGRMSRPIEPRLILTAAMQVLRRRPLERAI